MVRVFMLLLIAGFTAQGVHAASVEEGKSLFRNHCKACHHLEMRLVGPPLKGVNDRRNEEWLIKFIRSSTTMITAGDSVAVELFNTYNKVLMPDQALSEDEIRSILAYVADSEQVDSDAPFDRPEVVKSNAQPLSFTDFRFWIIYTVAVILVVVAVYYNAEMASIEEDISRQGDTSNQS